MLCLMYRKNGSSYLFLCLNKLFKKSKNKTLILLRITYKITTKKMKYLNHLANKLIIESYVFIARKIILNIIHFIQRQQKSRRVKINTEQMQTTA